MENIPSPFQLKDLGTIHFSPPDLDKLIKSTGAKAGMVILMDDKVPCSHFLESGNCTKMHEIKVVVSGVHKDHIENLLMTLIESNKRHKNGGKPTS